MADQQDGWRNQHEDGGTVAQCLDIPAPLQYEKGDQKFEIEIRREKDKLQVHRAVPDVVEIGGTAGLIDDADRHLHQFVQSQPEIFDVTLLNEVENQQESRHDQQQDGHNEAWQPLKKRVHRPQIERLLKVIGIAELERAVVEKVGVCRQAEVDV